MQKNKKATVIDGEIQALIDGIICSENFCRLKGNISHGKTSVYDHSLSVALASYKLAKRLKLRLDYHSLIRGALLHDYFFYDWHDKNNGVRLHGFSHNKTALANAQSEFTLSKTEKNIISAHMFPLTLFHMPKYKESWIVCLVDKWLALKETFCRKRAAKPAYPRLK